MDESTPEFLDLAPVYALDAVDEEQRSDIEAAVRAARPEVRQQFDSQVRDIRETMATQSAATALTPPPELLGRILAALTVDPVSEVPEPVSFDQARYRRRTRLLAAISAAAAVVILAIGGIVFAQQSGRESGEAVSARILAAQDVRSAVAPIEGGGSATVIFSKDVNAGVLVMNDVTPPAPGSVYQMWLLGPSHEPVSAGIMDAAAVSPSTTAVLTDIDESTSLGFSIEPPGGSTTPTGAIFARIALD